MMLTNRQFRAIAEIQPSIAIASRELNRAMRLASENNLAMTGFNLDPLRAAYTELACLMVTHLQQCSAREAEKAAAAMPDNLCRHEGPDYCAIEPGKKYCLLCGVDAPQAAQWAAV